MKTKRIVGLLFLLALILCVSLTACKAPGCAHAETDLVGAKPATCIAEGYSGDRVCRACGETVEVGTKLAMLTDHLWDEGAVTKNATCVSTGVKTFTCVTCFVTKTETVAVTECQNEYHFIGDEEHSLTCAVCFKSTNGAHTKGELVSSHEADCLEGAYEIYHCVDCDSDFKVYDETKPALGHAWDLEHPVVTSPTCSAEGSSHFVCKNAGCDAHTEEITLDIAPELHHYELSESVAPTCSSVGSKTYTCAYCEASYTETVGVLAHTYGEKITDGNWTHATCMNCYHQASIFNAEDADSAEFNPDKMSSDRTFEINFKNSAIEFPPSLAESFKGHDSLKIDAGFVETGVKDSLVSAVTSEEDRAVLADADSKIFDFSVNAGGEDIHEFNNTVTVTVPYTLAEGEDPRGIVIWYVTADGTLEQITDVTFCDEDGDGEGNVRFNVSHFSFYAVAYKETPEMRCRRGVHDYSSEALWKTVEATCSFHGYTKKVCRTCGITAFDNFVAAKEHSFGEKITPPAACDKGVYVHQICSACNAVKNYEYISPVGHKVTTVATCDKGAVCDTCHKILVPAYGHSWTEWNVLAQATEEQTGLKRRGCPTCGEVQEVVIPKISSIKPWELHSFEDMLEVLVFEALDFGDGKLSLQIGEGEEAQFCNVTVNETDGSYLAVMKFDFSSEDSGAIYYKDGKVVAFEGERGNVTDIDQIPNAFASDFEAMFNCFKSSFAYCEPDISRGIEAAKALLDEYVEVFGAGIDAQLKEAGKEYTAAQLKDALNSAQAIYAYFANKLGVTPVCGMPEGVSEPTAKDLHNLLSVFMEKTEADGNVTYKYDVSSLKTVLDEIVAEQEKLCDKPLAEALYTLCGDAIVAHFPELTDWDKLQAHLRTELAGSVKISTVVDKLLNFVESSGAITKDELFGLIDSALENVSGRVFDTEALLGEYGEKTVDEMIAEMGLMKDDVPMVANDLFDMINDYMTETKLGDAVVEEEHHSTGVMVPDGNGGFYDQYQTEVIQVTYRERLEEAKQMLESIKLVGSATVVLDAEGKILDMDLTFSVTDTEGNEMIPAYSVTLDRAKEQIEIPADVQTYLDREISFDYDDNGNLIISGLPTDDDSLDFMLDGYLQADLGNCLTLDAELTKKFGFNVYKLLEQYWTDSSEVGEYVKGPDGTLYEFTTNYLTRYEIDTMIPYGDLIENPTAYLPKADAPHNGIYEKDGETVYVYHTVAGKCYQENGVWMVATESRTDYVKDGITYYYYLEGVPFESVFASPKISNFNFNSGYDVYYDNSRLDRVGTLYLEAEKEEGMRNLGLEAALVGDEIYLLSSSTQKKNQHEIIIGSGVTDVPEYDKTYDYSYYDEEVYLLNGAEVEGYVRVELYKELPSYYAAYDGHYFLMSSYDYASTNVRLSSPFTKADVSALEELMLPDGRKLYVVETVGSVESAATVYGYLLVADGAYVATACEYRANELTDIFYRANPSTSWGCASEYKYLSADGFVDIDDYLTTAEDGKVTVSAEMIKLLRESAHGIGDGVAFVVSFGDENVICRYGTSLLLNLPEEFNPAQLDSVSGDVDWNDYFGTTGSSDSYSFTIEHLTNGSIVIDAGRGTLLDFEFRFDMDQVDPSDVAILSTLLSEKYGFDVYTTTEQNTYTDTYAFYNGAYYSVMDVEIANGYVRMTPEEIIKGNWRLGEFYYRMDELNEDGSLGARIYRSELSFYNGANTYYTQVNVKVIDGTVYILTGISEESDITLKYEGQVTLSEFINGLALEKGESYATSGYYYDGNKSLGRTSYRLTYGGAYVTSVDVFYLADRSESTVFIDGGFDRIRIPNPDFTRTLPASWNEISREDGAWNGMEYELVYGRYVETVTSAYAQIGDTYVSVYSTMYNDRDVYQNIAESTYIVGAETPNGWVYYSSWDYGENGIEGIGEITVPADALLYREDYVGTNADGYEIYHFNMYDKSTVDEYELSNGVKVYAQAGSTSDCYAKLKDDTYVRGYLMMTESGYEFHPSDYWMGEEFNSRELVGALGLRKLIKTNGVRATLSPELLTKLEKYSDHVQIEVTVIMDGYSSTMAHVSYGEFASWFEA